MDRLLVERPGLVIGWFRCPPGEAAWSHPNVIGGGPLVVFPTTAVEIAHVDRPAVVANVNVAMFYNADQRYVRRLLDPRGDRCLYVALGAATYAAIAAEHDPAAAEVPGHPFGFDRAPIDASLHLRHAALAEIAGRGDPLEVEEEAVDLVRAVVARGFGAPRPPPVRSSARHRDAVHRLERRLSVAPTDDHTLGELADAVELSPYHAARLFRAHTGRSLHEYRTHLRLRSSLRALADPTVDLTELALGLGFASHSHFTTRFRRVFGAPPSAVRGRWATLRRLRART
ncbi:MAG: AraC family transcriptional regulator [Myxococcota bacterium]